MVFYIGFSSEKKFVGSSVAGTALSEYTRKLLSKITKVNFVTISHYGNTDVNTIRASKMHLLTIIRLTSHIFLNTSRLHDKIIFYHSPIYFIPCLIFITLGYRVILQVNEVFYRTENYSGRKLHAFLEILLLHTVKKVIVSTQKLKPYLANRADIVTEIPGPLSVLDEAYKTNKRTIGKTLLVYAGIVDTSKNKGAFLSAEVMKLLPQNFCLDIYGFGNTNDIAELKSYIDYHKLTNVNLCEQLDPLILSRTLQNYDFGLAIQNIDNKFSFSSFPSKVITYLGAGLEVICMNVETISEWRFEKYVHYKHDNTAQSIAEYIKSISVNSFIDASEFAHDYESNIVADLRDII